MELTRACRLTGAMVRRWIVLSVVLALVGCFGSQDGAPEVAASTLKSARTVIPKFPSQLQSQRVQGWVNMKFTVTRDGAVSNVKVSDSLGPPEMVEAATKALKQWRFEPVMRDGKPVEQRAYITMTFDPEEVE